MSKTWSTPTKQNPTLTDEEKRLNVLFSPFRTRESNPVDYDSKLKYWKESIDNLCKETKIATFTLTSLEKELTKNNKSPSCIPTVIDEILKCGEAMKLDDFLKISPGQSWGSWVFSSLFITPATWSFGKLIEALDLGKDEDSNVDYINLKYLKSIGIEAVKTVEKEGKLIISKKEFHTMIGPFPEETLNYVIHWLRIDKKAYVRNVAEGRQFLKVGNNAKSFSESETLALLLEDNRVRLIETIESLEKDKKDSVELVRKQLREGSKTLAKSTLRRSKELEKVIVRKGIALENLDSLVTRIHETKSDAEVFEAYKYGLVALKEKMKENGLDEDSVSDTMTDMQDISEMHEDIQSALMLPISPGDDSQLEEELNAILSSKEEKQSDGEKETLLVLPDVPVSPPSQTKAEQDNLEILQPVGLM